VYKTGSNSFIAHQHALVHKPCPDGLIAQTLMMDPSNTSAKIINSPVCFTQMFVACERTWKIGVLSGPMSVF